MAKAAGFGKAKWHLQEAIDAVDDRVANIIENETAPFWEIVRDAIAGRSGPVCDGSGSLTVADVDERTNYRQLPDERSE